MWTLLLLIWLVLSLLSRLSSLPWLCIRLVFSLFSLRLLGNTIFTIWSAPSFAACIFGMAVLGSHASFLPCYLAAPTFLFLYTVLAILSNDFF